MYSSFRWEIPFCKYAWHSPSKSVSKCLHDEKQTCLSGIQKHYNTSDESQH